MLRTLLSLLPERPRLDLSLLTFALAGLAAALLMPVRDPVATQPGRYALAIAHGDDLKLAAKSAIAIAIEAPATARVLSCRNVVSVGPLDIGSRCRDAVAVAPALAQAD
jgi:hypothetical protein